MSKTRRAKHKAKRRRQKAAVLLGNLAEALNDCERHGVRIRHPKIAVFTDYGVIVPFKKGWAVRPFAGQGPVPQDSLDD